VARTDWQIALLREEILRKQRLYDRVQGEAEQIAVALYKGGPTQQIEVFLGARNLQDLTSLVAYSRAAVVNRNEMVIGLNRLRVQLDGQQADLEEKLVVALDAEGVQAALAQQLRELRLAHSTRLSKVREQIRSERKEIESLAAQSAQIEQQLSGTASTTFDGSKISGAGFAWPIRGVITSGFGPRWGRFHEGIDIDGETGDPIHASKAGTVFSVSYDAGGYGYYIVLDHGGGYSTLYGHTSAQYVHEGQSVSQGETIAAVGATGDATGSHLHFEIRVNGAPQDPLRYLP
jgi:murein DD-endopeptidase MepM/ murein hydrolase activator NlpD